MRYESALQVIRFLKQSYGTPVPILHIARGIELSYQPTHRHVRTLEQLGVIETRKVGREVLCRLRSSEATHVWLALLALVERARLLNADGATGQLAATLRRTVSQLTTGGLDAVALCEPFDGSAPSVVLLVEARTREALLRRFRARCRAVAPDTEISAFDAEDLARHLADPVVQQEWVATMAPLHGEQRFWAAVL